MANQNYDGIYHNFMFMAGWRDALEGFAEEMGMEFAKEALWNLMLAGTLDEQELPTDSKAIQGFVRGCIQPVVKSSTANYNQNRENGKKGGRPKIEIDVALAIKMHDEDKMTWAKVAQHFGVNTDTLKKARDAFADSEKPKNREIETEKPKNDTEKITEVFSEKTEKHHDDEIVRKTEKPKKDEFFSKFVF